MSALTTTKELRNMTPEDLAKEIRAQEGEVVKLRLGVKLGKEKDSAKYVRQKKQLARMKTVYSETVQTGQKEQKKNTSVPSNTSVSSGPNRKNSSANKK
ncbi:MAG: 50S ribosomal protein L29 [Candidatus Peregrinibacteria bacterium]|nr:50S ribosomal protein L29 [Candidatus Peregrinibacteria bacterium]MCB9807738.1 50S ribosomal protein L29 [Candidatus Peribacteria bacterium]